MPKALAAFRLLFSRCLKVVEDLEPTELAEYVGLANPKDLQILAVAIREECSLLTAINLRRYQPGYYSVTVLKLGDLVLRSRYLLVRLSD